MRHLHALGHCRIATICGTGDTLAGAERLRGYRVEMEALGLPIDASWVRDADFDAETGRAAAEELLALSNPPSAIFAACDLSAAGGDRGRNAARPHRRP